jgi:hypothetical protein
VIYSVFSYLGDCDTLFDFNSQVATMDQNLDEKVNIVSAPFDIISYKGIVRLIVSTIDYPGAATGVAH